MTSKIDETIQHGADLARAREQFPDIVPYAEGSVGGSRSWPEREYMSASFIPDMADCVRQGCGDHVRLGKRFGTVIVFEVGAADRLARPYVPYGDGTLTGLLDRLSTHRASRDAIVAALSTSTWEAFMNRKAAVASYCGAHVADDATQEQAPRELPKPRPAALGAIPIIPTMLSDFDRWTNGLTDAELKSFDVRYVYSGHEMVRYELTRDCLEGGQPGWPIAGAYEIHILNPVTGEDMLEPFRAHEPPGDGEQASEALFHEYRIAVRNLRAQLDESERREKAAKEEAGVAQAAIDVMLIGHADSPKKGGRK